MEYFWLGLVTTLGSIAAAYLIHRYKGKRIYLEGVEEPLRIRPGNKFQVTENNVWMLDVVLVFGQDALEILRRNKFVLCDASLEELFKKSSYPIWTSKNSRNFFSAPHEIYGPVEKITAYQALVDYKLNLSQLEAIHEKGSF